VRSTRSLAVRCDAGNGTCKRRNCRRGADTPSAQKGERQVDELGAEPSRAEPSHGSTASTSGD